MIITAMYLYGVMKKSWKFKWGMGLLAFLMDLMIAGALAGRLY